MHVSVPPLSHNSISNVVLLHCCICCLSSSSPSLPQHHCSLFVLFTSCLPVQSGPTAVCGGSAVTLSRLKKKMCSANCCIHSNQFAGRIDNPVECMEVPCRRTLQQEGEEGGTPGMITEQLIGRPFYDRVSMGNARTYQGLTPEHWDGHS